MDSARRPVVLVPHFLLEDHRADLESAIADGARILDADDAAASDDLPDALEVVITGMEKTLLERAISAPGVRWVHSISAGVEHLPLDVMAERGVLLTNAAGAYATAMAEYALGAMIMLARNLPSWLAGQRERRWIEGGTFDAMVLRDKRLGIVGYGAVGRELATAARALGMEIWATKRSPLFATGEPLDRLLPATDLLELLAESDAVVLCASLNRSTRRLIGERELGAMKPTAMLVNVARGGLIDEDALARALEDGRLRGAMLDVTAEEPLPAESPLWSAPNLLLTPHISGNAPESWRWGVDFLCANLRLYLDGTPERMGNLVDYDAVR
jgi:phosphoglycerate dehydrogenase-like enzyme